MTEPGGQSACERAEERFERGSSRCAMSEGTCQRIEAISIHEVDRTFPFGGKPGTDPGSGAALPLPGANSKRRTIVRQDIEFTFDLTIAIGLFLSGLARKAHEKERLVVANFTKRRDRAFRQSIRPDYDVVMCSRTLVGREECLRLWHNNSPVVFFTHEGFDGVEGIEHRQGDEFDAVIDVSAQNVSSLTSGNLMKFGQDQRP
jgi:hypothetical protein